MKGFVVFYYNYLYLNDMKELFKEIWRPVKGFEGLYEVSDLGNVRSLDRTITEKNTLRKKLIKGKHLKLINNSHNYYEFPAGKPTILMVG